MNTITRTTPRHVEWGVAFLDEHEPGWADAIDLAILDIGDDCHCVLGQLHGEYRHGLANLGLDDDDACRLGFNAYTKHDWPHLTEAWTRIIGERQA